VVGHGILCPPSEKLGDMSAGSPTTLRPRLEHCESVLLLSALIVC